MPQPFLHPGDVGPVVQASVAAVAQRFVYSGNLFYIRQQ